MSSTRARALIPLVCGVSICYLAYLQLLKLHKINRKLTKKKKFRRKKGQKAREEAQQKLKEEKNENAVEKKPKGSQQPPSKKQRLNESEDETSSSSSDDSSMTESDDSSLISQSSDTESNSESDISSLTDDTFGNYDKNDNDGRIDDFDENEINEAMAVKPEPYDDPLATTASNIIEKPNNDDEEDIKPNVSELDVAMEIQNLHNEENPSLSNILQVVRVKEEPNTL